MTRESGSQHPEIEVLAEYAAEGLEADRRASIARHLEDCPLCRLELKQLRRFESIDEDEELLAEADWNRADFALRGALHDRILPEVTGAAPDPSPRPLPRRDWTRRLLWLAPAAAAATLLIVMLGRGFWGSEPGVAPAGHEFRDALRGESVISRDIVPLSPAGELKTFPEAFAWRPARDFDSFALDVFSAELTAVFRVEGLAESAFTLPDSLRSRLAPDLIYLWSVEGYRGLDRVAVSPSGWFRVRAPSQP